MAQKGSGCVFSAYQDPASVFGHDGISFCNVIASQISEFQNSWIRGFSCFQMPDDAQNSRFPDSRIQFSSSPEAPCQSATPDRIFDNVMAWLCMVCVLSLNFALVWARHSSSGALPKSQTDRHTSLDSHHLKNLYYSNFKVMSMCHKGGGSLLKNIRNHKKTSHACMCFLVGL